MASPSQTDKASDKSCDIDEEMSDENKSLRGYLYYKTFIMSFLQIQ